MRIEVGLRRASAAAGYLFVVGVRRGSRRR
jgi:hypothetical protein